MICSGGEDGTVRQWNPKTGQCRHVFTQVGSNCTDWARLACVPPYCMSVHYTVLPLLRISLERCTVDADRYRCWSDWSWWLQGDAHEAEVTCIASGGADADFVLTGEAPAVSIVLYSTVPQS
jgi:WD40 repeat protein